MIEQEGPPTLFITLSCAEWYSPEFIKHLREINKNMPGIDKMTAGELTSMDPVFVSVHFQQKWRAIFNELICAKDKPIFGKVNHFWRIDYQARGAPHVHCILWIEDAPVIGTSSIEEVVEYLDSIITCELPDKLTSPTLHKLVADHQIHRCSKYCQRKFKRNQKWISYCIFGFPRPLKEKTEMHDIIDCLAHGSNRKKPRRRIYDLQRKDTERYVSDFIIHSLL
jgi:hypothetical protein